jgi:polyisoprenoid-binding protein YceI
MARPLDVRIKSASFLCGRVVLQRALLSLVFTSACTFAQPAFAQESIVSLDPAKTTVEFTLGASLHTVHGAFKLKTGAIHFDPASGNASGAIIVDAASGDSGSDGRDKKMHQEILESPKFTEITFVPTAVHGAIASQGTSQVAVDGILKLHGQDHEVTLNFTVQSGAAGEIQAATKFSVPYVKWGLKNPSTFLLKVNDVVDIDIHTVGQLTPSSSRH